MKRERIHQLCSRSGGTPRPIIPILLSNLVVAIILFALPALAQKFDPTSPEWEIPHVAPRNPVWYDDWLKASRIEVEAKAESNNAKGLAKMELQIADAAKASERYADAAKLYEKALQLDPTLASASYQLACNYALWGKPQEAKKAFERAVEIGFADYSMSYADDELGAIRLRPDFGDKMRTIRNRYLNVQKSLLGQPIAFRPQSQKPKAGWPVIVVLHGYGDTHLSFISECVDWASLGVLAIALPGSVPGMDRYAWSLHSIEPTHQDVQAVLKSLLLKEQVDEKRVVLLGFSQGATHALGLLKNKPAHYFGAVAFSPGGQPFKYVYPTGLDAAQPKRLYLIYGSKEQYGSLGDRYRAACSSAKWEFKLLVHRGGHQLPVEWETQREPAKRFVLGLN